MSAARLTGRHERATATCLLFFFNAEPEKSRHHDFAFLGLSVSLFLLVGEDVVPGCSVGNTYKTLSFDRREKFVSFHEIRLFLDLPTY